MKIKGFNREKVFGEVDESNLRFNTYTREERQAFLDGATKTRKEFEEMLNAILPPTDKEPTA